MKIFAFILFLYLSFSAADSIYAGNTTLTANYPATSGTYNKIIINTLSGAITCTKSSAGMLFMSGSTLEICGDTGSGASLTPVAIPSGETCFNVFCSYSSGSGCATPSQCPANYPKSTTISDTFVTTVGYNVVSSLCCGPVATGVNAPNPTVLP